MSGTVSQFRKRILGELVLQAVFFYYDYGHRKDYRYLDEIQIQ